MTQKTFHSTAETLIFMTMQKIRSYVFYTPGRWTDYHKYTSQCLQHKKSPGHVRLLYDTILYARPWRRQTTTLRSLTAYQAASIDLVYE